MQDVLEILKLALDKEIVRKQAYDEAAKAATNPLVKNTFAALANEELKHELYIKTYYDKQVAEEGWPSPDEIGVEDDEDFREVIREIFKNASEQIKATAAEAQAELTDVYNAGIAAERESVEFYSDAYERATDPNAKAFFEALVKAEKLHLKLLSDTLEFLDDTSMWFFEEEQWSVEG